MAQLKTLAALTIAALLLSGCASNKPLYHWGSYEQLILSSYTEPGRAEPLVQIEKLTTGIEQAQANGQKVAPGIFAHLGLMYAELGRVAQSMAAFEQEKLHFPESAIFIDGLMERAKNAGSNR